MKAWLLPLLLAAAPAAVQPVIIPLQRQPQSEPAPPPPSPVPVAPPQAGPTMVAPAASALGTAPQGFQQAPPEIVPPTPAGSILQAWSIYGQSTAAYLRQD